MILAEALKLYCEHNNIRVRALEKVTGVARSPLSRFLNGKAIDSDNFTKLLSWVMQPPEKLPHSVPPKIPDTTTHANSNGNQIHN